MALLRRLTAATGSLAAPQLHRPLSTAAEHYPVAIVGGGPTGLTLSALLSSYGVASALFERAPALSEHPQAHYINNRTMEVFRGMDGLADDVKALSPPLALWRRFVYCESLVGPAFGAVDHFKGQDTAQTPLSSPEPVAHLSQNRLLQLLLQRAVSPSNQVHMAHTIHSVEQTADAVIASGITSEGRAMSFSCDYLVVADGANSQIRGQLGITMEGQRAIQSLINVHFTSAALGRMLADRPAMLYFVFNAAVIAVIVAHDLEQGEFVAQVPFFPPLQQHTAFTPEVCRRLLSEAAGAKLPDVSIRSIRPWTMSAEVASSMRQSHIFLAGDAAHRFPPAGGFGMNTGFQDAHNLAWKLAGVLQGRAGPGLLDSYEAERRPVALANTALSVANFEESLAVPKVLGLDPRAASVLTSALTSQVAASMLPTGVAQALFQSGLQLGQRLSALQGPIGRWRRAQLSKLFDSGSSLRLQFPKEDIGFVYGASGATCPDLLPQASPATGAATAARGDPYVPTTAPGARLPHANLQPANGGAAVSTLDLVVRQQHPRLLLLLDGSPAAAEWSEAALQLASEGLLLHTCSIAATAAEAAEMAKHLTAADVFVDTEGSWSRVQEVPSEAAILVRPDGHVAWRSGPLQGSKDMQAALRVAVQQVLGL